MNPLDIQQLASDHKQLESHCRTLLGLDYRPKLGPAYPQLMYLHLEEWEMVNLSLLTTGRPAQLMDLLT